MKRAKQSLPYCKIHKDSIDVPRLTARVSAVENGAVCTFIGQVRNLSRGKKVAYLEYDAYVPMAEKMLARIAAEASDKWKAQIAIEHRIGRIELGEPSVAVCVGTPHRDASFEACRYCIDTLKETVPIWKKEVCPDGAFWIEGDSAVQS
jgi:molybdopterin synthase catalytic subunit